MHGSVSLMPSLGEAVLAVREAERVALVHARNRGEAKAENVLRKP